MSEIWKAVRGVLLWAWALILAAAFAFTFVNVVQTLASRDAQSFTLEYRTRLGMEVDPATTAIQAPFWVGVTRVVPGGAAEAAGVRAGDSVRFDTVLARQIRWEPGTHVGLTVARGDERFRAAIVARAPQPPGSDPTLIMALIARLLTLCFIAHLVVRGWRSRPALQMAAILTGIGFNWLFVPDLPLLPQAVILMVLVSSATTTFLWPVYCLELSGGASSRRQARLVYGAAMALVVVDVSRRLMGGQILPAFGLDPNVITVFSIVADQLLGYAVAASNYARNDAATRNRIKIVVGAFAVLMVAEVIYSSAISDLKYVFVYGLRFVALALLTYGILKQRMFDLGFAINRTLVYGSVSFILLAAFGRAEWAADRLLPESWHTESLLFSAGVAVVLFLSFHRLRDWIERHVERLFFSSWHRAEASLRRFVGSAGHFEQVEALCSDFVGELRRFSGGAPAALYLRDKEGGYALCAGQVPGVNKTYDNDGRAFAMMRSERQPLDLALAEHPLPGALALPMLDQGALTGFALLGEKPDRAQYRPDKIENLGWAASQVGLDLRALHAHLLEQQVFDLSDKVSSLSERNTVLSEHQERLMAMLENAQTALGRS